MKWFVRVASFLFFIIIAHVVHSEMPKKQNLILYHKKSYGDGSDTMYYDKASIKKIDSNIIEVDTYALSTGFGSKTEYYDKSWFDCSKKQFARRESWSTGYGSKDYKDKPLQWTPIDSFTDAPKLYKRICSDKK